MLRPDNPLYWMQKEAKQRGDVLVPDRWVNLLQDATKESRWLLLFLPVWVIVGFMLAVTPAFLGTEEE